MMVFLISILSYTGTALRNASRETADEPLSETEKDKLHRSQKSEHRTIDNEEN